MRREENSLSWYVRNSEEALLRKVGDSNVVEGFIFCVSQRSPKRMQLSLIVGIAFGF